MVLPVLACEPTAVNFAGSVISVKTFPPDSMALLPEVCSVCVSWMTSPKVMELQG